MAKKFEDYVDGEQVVFRNRYEPDYVFKAYKSLYTYNAFRLKNHTGEVIADITEIEPYGVRNEKPNPDLQRGSGYSNTQYIDSDADSSGFYDRYDPNEIQD